MSTIEHVTGVRMENPVAASPFDGMAADYDQAFSRTSLGVMMRQAVWSRLDALFPPGSRVLELNCGTGEDAVYLAARGISVVATDASTPMVRIVHEKAAAAGVEDRVQVSTLAIENIASFAIAEDRPFDGVLSNFGGLNCVQDMRAVASGLATCVKPGGVALLCLMGPLCPWEWGWFLVRRQPGKAFRRLRRSGTPWRGITIRYPSIRKVRQAFAPHFRLRRASALAAILPPPFAQEWAGRHPRLTSRLNRLERRFETCFPLPWLADHYVLELERVP
jgi:SAM-dependent methyltransferase